MTADELFWDLVEPMYADPAVQRSTMMGFPCVRFDGRFFASLERGSGALLVKLPAKRVAQLIDAGHGEPFRPAGRAFREWVAVTRPDRRRWRTLLAEARDYAAGTRRGGLADAARENGSERPSFSGFGPAGLSFLAELERDNTKRFFDAHREVYRRDLLEPSKAFVVALGAQLRRLVSPGLRAEPRIGGSLFRIANDLRFRRDKPPYKTHLDFAFWEGPTGPRTDPALIVRIMPSEILVGAGVPTLTGGPLDRYRSALHDERLVAELDDRVAALLAGGAELSEPTRRRPPPGFDRTELAAQYALRDGFYVVRSHPRPAAITSARLVSLSANWLAPFAPLQQWLSHHAT